MLNAVPDETLHSDATLLSVDRPGYGASGFVRPGEWASVASAADDIAEILDSRRIQSVGIIGWSAGGRVALALAARRPDLVKRVVVIATPAPQEQVPWIPAEQLAMLDKLRNQSPDEVHAALSQQLSALVPPQLRVEQMLQQLGVGDADQRVLAKPGVHERLLQMLMSSAAQGAKGIVGDIAGYCLQPWGFEPKDVKAPTQLFYGTGDSLITESHGRWYETSIPHAHLEMIPDCGHLVAFPVWRRALDFATAP